MILAATAIALITVTVLMLTAVTYRAKQRGGLFRIQYEPGKQFKMGYFPFREKIRQARERGL